MDRSATATWSRSAEACGGLVLAYTWDRCPASCRNGGSGAVFVVISGFGVFRFPGGAVRVAVAHSASGCSLMLTISEVKESTWSHWTLKPAASITSAYALRFLRSRLCTCTRR
jgi:hypothetical protein